MKNIFKQGILILLLCGCSDDFLDLQPKTFQNSSAFYKTEAQFELAVNGIYAPLQAIYNNSMWTLAEMRSDNTTYQANHPVGAYLANVDIDEFQVQDGNSVVASFYNNAYASISRSNIVLDRIVGANFDQDKKDQFIGEAKFLRAFNYFNLVRICGDVILTLHEIETTDGALSGTRASASVVYDAILADVTDAIELLPNPAIKDGRATEGAARTLLAEVYMTQGDFPSAITQLREVASLGYHLLDDYADIYDPANKNNAESIFEIQYLEGEFGTHSSFMYLFAPIGSGGSVAYFPIAAGANSGWNIPTPDMIAAYEPGDLRKEISLSEGYVNSKGAFVAVPYVKKYQHPHAVRYQTNDNFPVYRYADALLMLAEALNEVGFVPDGEAFDLLNQVRDRANLAPKTSANADPNLQVANQEAFRRAVAQERRVELAFENHRWFDLVRTGKAVEVMTGHGEMMKQQFTLYYPKPYEDINLLYPIPARERKLNQALTQNPGY